MRKKKFVKCFGNYVQAIDLLLVLDGDVVVANRNENSNKQGLPFLVLCIFHAFSNVTNFQTTSTYYAIQR